MEVRRAKARRELVSDIVPPDPLVDERKPQSGINFLSHPNQELRQRQHTIRTAPGNAHVFTFARLKLKSKIADTKQAERRRKRRRRRKSNKSEGKEKLREHCILWTGLPVPESHFPAMLRGRM